MRTLFLIIGVLGATTAGCGREATTAPPPQSPPWTLLRFEARGDGAVDSTEFEVAVLPSGELTLRYGRGNVVSSRGLLAGGKLETLACLVDALPPDSYASPTPCGPGGFRLVLSKDGEERSFVSGPCDPAAPPSISEVADFLRARIADLLAPPAKILPGALLLSGVESRVREARRLVVRDRDALVRLLREHSPEQPVAVPRVDFARQMVVAEFLGERPTSGFSVEWAGAELTQSRVTRIRFEVREPGEACATQDVVTAPFVLAAIEARPEVELVYETETVAVRCE